jgi:hypothetical protein
VFFKDTFGVRRLAKLVDESPFTAVKARQRESFKHACRKNVHSKNKNKQEIIGKV